MTSGKKDKESTVCILPWLSLHVKTTGIVAACCLSDTYLFGTSRDMPMDQILHSPQANAFRKSMIEGKLPAACAICAEAERAGQISSRQAYNERFSKHFDLVDKTREDGSVPEIRYVMLDLRVSNVCNFLCRMCNPNNSSSIAQEQKAAGEIPREGSPIVKAFGNTKRLVEFLEPRLEHLEEIYFAGGEPLLLEEHYAILDILISKKKTRIPLRYSTNFSKLSHAGRDVIELWRKFENVTLKASLDASGARAEYMRHGTRWKDIEANRLRLLREAPHVEFYLAPTLQIFNALHFPDFHLDWVARGWVSLENVHFNTLREPSHYSLTALPPLLKKEFSDKWMEYAIRLRELGAQQLPSAALGVIRFARKSEDWDLEKSHFLAETEKLDRRRGESMFEVFPELKNMLN